MLAGENGILTKANDASESTNQENIKEEIELLLQEAYISEYIDDIDKMEYLKTKLLEAGAESLWDSESYSKEYWKYKDAVIIINPDKYTINFTKNTLVNNEGNSEDKGFLVDISQGGIPRKDIESIIFSSNKIPENYTISYDVSESKDEQVVLYGVQNANGRYDVTIVAANNEEIYAPEYSARLFGDLTNLKTINLDNLNTSNVTNMYIMFSGCINLENIDISHLDTKNVEIMTNMFSNCKNLKSINLEGIDTRSVTTMQGMFTNCTQLVDINLENIHTANVTNMSSMFSNCNNITNLDLSNWDTSKVTTMYYMFNQCSKLQNLDISSFNTENVTNMQNMFYLCTSLSSLNLQSFNTKNVEYMNSIFAGCSNLTTIYVSKSWNTDNANVGFMFYNCGTNTVTIV